MTVLKCERPISFLVSFCIYGRPFKLISFTFVWERETLAVVHSTQLRVLVNYNIISSSFSINVGVLYNFTVETDNFINKEVISTISKFYL